MTPTPQQPPSGWYPDPAGGTGERFWDGEAWSQSTRDRKAPETHGQEIPDAPYGTGYAQAGQSQQASGTPWVDPRLRAHANGYGTFSNDYGSRAGKGMVPVQGGFALAGFWWRVLGFLIDSIIVGVVNGIATAGISASASTTMDLYLVKVLDAMAGSSGELPPVPDNLMHALWTMALVSMVIWVAYRTILIGTMNATLGQKICGLRVAVLGDEQLRPVGWKVALIRGGLGAVLYQFLGFFAQITVLFLDRKQTLPDLISKTVVVNTREAV